jgi:hypothetical protein
MLLLPIASPLGVLGIAKIALVLGLGQPSSLQLPFPGLATVGFEAEALPLCAPAIGEKKFFAV